MTSDTATVIAPRNIEYSKEVQAHAAGELDELPPPCPRDAVFGGCSAVHRFVIDYGWQRKKIRALHQKDDE